MDPLFAALFVIGCTHDMQLCRPSMEEPYYFVDMEQCERDAVSIAKRHSDDFPNVVVECKPVEAKYAINGSEMSWQVARDGNISFSFQGPQIELASN